MSVHYVKRAGEETTFAPLDLVLTRALSEECVAIAAQTDEHLLEEILSRRQRFAGRNFKDHSIHVHVAGEVQIHAAAFDFWPRLHLMRHHIKDHMLIVIPRDLCVFDPVAIKVALDSAAAADVRGTVNWVFLLYRFGLRLWLRFFGALRVSRLKQAAAE